MLQKWKHIINNWINCYFDESSQDDRKINVDTLLNIISHLRENLNLDESKSSVLAAHTVKEFILEKYPSFKFGNGTIDVGSEDDIYLVASLLLFFVCVNSKDVDIKSAMCSKLSVDDQEIILKFSKSLLECSPITCRDVDTAITDACGQEMATIDTGRAKVAETPPALRSLHGEVRRLQAALDAERFDRNYLQDELNRTNSRLDKLLKDKEQYKLDIMNLKAKLSECSGGEADARGAQAGADDSAKLARQLQDMEERLVKTNELLDDTVYERDALKAKVEELKQDRDKWLTLSQTEAARAVQLSEELETERRHMQSLRELVNELRQHNRLNGLDCSQLECDDPDASMQSLAHNLSVCSEACANVVEVQLGEERAKVNALLLQIETLQRENEQLHITIEEENSNHEIILKEKDCTIDNLEKQIAEQTALLESLRKDHEDVILSWEKYKLETKQLLSDSEIKIQQLDENINSLSQSIAVLENAKKDMMVKSQELIEQIAELESTNGRLMESLTQINEKYTIVIQEKEKLHNELKEEKSTNNILEKEHSKLDKIYKKLVADNSVLLNEKAILAQQLAEEKSLRQITEEQKKTLAAQNAANEKKFTKQQKHMEKKMAKDASKFQALVQETELLGQQVKEMKSLIQKFEKEKNVYQNEKTLLEQSISEFRTTKDEMCKRLDLLIEKQDLLEQQYLHEKSNNENLKQENEQLIQSLTEEMTSRSTLLKETEFIVNQNESLKGDLEKQKSVEEALVSDKELLLAEKDKLVETLEVEKAARDKVESEKVQLILKLEELNKQVMSVVENTEIQIGKLREQLDVKCEEISKRAETEIISKLEKIKLIEQEKQSVTDELKKVKEQLEGEIRLLKEKLIHYEQLSGEMKKSYEKQITELQTEKECLQQLIEENKIELSKQTETYNTELNAKLEEIQSIQQENETLTRTLDDVKVQLEREIFSLKEKLLQNEDLTDEMKKCYETQIIELQTETERLQQVINETKIEMTKQTETHTSELDTKVSEIQLIQQENKYLTKELNDVKIQLKTELHTLEEKLLQNEQLTEEIKKSYEYQVTELQTEAERLQHVINANNIEQTKQNEFHTTALDAKLAEIESITNNFNIVKGQLEGEIDSLKEKLIHNEQSIEQMMQSYEQQVFELQAETQGLQEALNVTKIDQEKFHSNISTILTTALEQFTEDLEKTGVANEIVLKLKSITDYISLPEKCHLLINVANALFTEVVTTKKSLEWNTAVLEEFKEVMKQKDAMLTEKQNESTRLQQIVNETINGQEDLNKQISTILNTGLKQVLLDLQNENIIIDEIEKLTNTQKNDSIMGQCNLLIKTVHLLINQVITKTKALENNATVLSELKEALNEKETLITELQTEAKRLQQTVQDTKFELSKQAETFTTALNTKQKEINIIEKENQSLTADLNDVKVQLDVKVHSLKEKLVDSENLTDKLKKSYECQIDNLNLMVTKLTNYLKDKTAELEAIRKENHRLQQLIDENTEAIKSLEEEVKSEKQNQEKLLNDFESERQVLKNMVTVTESVMEDQKLALNNAITEHIKAKETLQEENNNIKAENEIKIKEYELKIVEKDTSLQSVLKELAEMRTAKERIEKEINLQRGSLDEQIVILKDEIQKREVEIINLKEDNEKLQATLQDYKNNVISLQNENDEWKIKMDACEAECRNKVDKLTESLNEKAEKTEQLNEAVREMETERKELIAKISALNQEHNDLIKEKDVYVAKLNELKDSSATNLTQCVEEIGLLKEENKKLEEKLNKLKLDNTELSEELNKLKKDNSEIEEASRKSNENNKTLVNELDALKSVKEELEEQINKFNTVKTELEDELNKLRKDNVELAKDLSELKQNNTELVKETSQFTTNARELTEENTKLMESNLTLLTKMNVLESEKTELTDKISTLTNENTKLVEQITKLKGDNASLLAKINDLESVQTKLSVDIGNLETSKTEINSENVKLALELNKFEKDNAELSVAIEDLKNNNAKLSAEISELRSNNTALTIKIDALEKDQTESAHKIGKLEMNNSELVKTIEEKKAVITNLEAAIKHEQEAQKKQLENNVTEKQALVNKCDILQTYHTKAEKELEERHKEITSLQREVQTLKSTVELCERESKAKDGIISKMSKEKDAVINNLNKELAEEKASKDKRNSELEEKVATIMELKGTLDKLNNEREALNILKKENEELIKAVGQRETFAVRSQENTASHKYHSGPLAERELRDIHHQVDNTSDLTHSSLESLKTISDLERIIQDKNRTITTLQSDVTYLKTLMAESETKLLDVNKELEVSKENCHQLSMQLKKIVHQKNDEMAELKKQVNKMSATENRASQIIKVSAKYQAIILKRIAEIKNNTVLKELTNFGNSNGDSELRRSLTAGSVTMEDLENFLETTERHIKKCSDKQLALQKERDRLTEVNRINESEIINLKKFLTELSVSFQTFSSVKDLYAQKLSRVISVQRTVRREILSLDGRITDAAMLKLERGYGAAMQDLSECAMNLERWVERCISRTISSEKIKQAFMHDSERASLAPATQHNAGLEVQLDELEHSFQKLLEEASRAAKGEGARDAAAVTVMEVRAEYEDKLNRMKAKMKQLYTEQIAVFKEKQKEEIAGLERELSKAREKLASTSRAYEEHIRGLTTELWSVGEKFLMKKDEAEWLRRKQRSGSLMSLQHVHSSGLVPMQEEGRPSDTYSLRSLPVKNNPPKQEGRDLHMSDEEGEVFDNRYLKELTATPRRESMVPPGQRLSELRWRNSLCPPHLKSSYPAETQFAQAIDEDEIKAMNAASRNQRKEVGITAYKKPGPPTPSKQAGRLSATDSELRESLRVEMEPQPSRKTSTPSRIRSLFRSSKTDTTEGTPRSRRLSNIFRKK